MSKIRDIIMSIDHNILNLLKSATKEKPTKIKKRIEVHSKTGTYWREQEVNAPEAENPKRTKKVEDNEVNGSANAEPKAKKTRTKKVDQSNGSANAEPKQSVEQSKDKPIIDIDSLPPELARVVSGLKAEEKEAFFKVWERTNGLPVFGELPKNEDKITRGSRQVLAKVNGHDLTEATIHLQPIQDGKLPDFIYLAGLDIPKSWKNILVSQDSTKPIWAIGIDDNGDRQYMYSPEFRKQAEETKYKYVQQLSQVEGNILEAFQALDPSIYGINNRASEEYRLLTAAKNALTFMFKTGVRVGSKSAKQKNSQGALELTCHNVSQEIRYVKYEDGSIERELIYKIDFVGKDGIPQHIDVFDAETKDIIARCFNTAEARRKDAIKRIPGYKEALDKYKNDLDAYISGVRSGKIKHDSKKAPAMPDIVKNVDCRLFPISYSVITAFLAQTSMTPKDLRTLYASHITKQALGESVNEEIREAGTPTRFLEGHASDPKRFSKTKFSAVTDIEFPKRPIDLSKVKPPVKTLDDAIKYAKSIDDADKQAKVFQQIMLGVSAKVSDYLGNEPIKAFESYIDPQIWQEWQPELMDNWKKYRDNQEKLKRQERIKNLYGEDTEVDTSTNDSTEASQSANGGQTEVEEKRKVRKTRNLYKKTSSYLKPVDKTGIPSTISAAKQAKLQTCTNIMVSTDPSQPLLAKGTLPNGKPYYVYKNSYYQERRAKQKEDIKSVIKNSDKVDTFIDTFMSSKDESQQEIGKMLYLLRHTGLPLGDGKKDLDSKYVGISNLSSDNVFDFTDQGKGWIVQVHTKRDDIKHISVTDEKAIKILDELSKNNHTGNFFKTSPAKFRVILGQLKLTPTDIRALRATELARQALKGLPKPTNAKEFTGQMNLICGTVGEAIGVSRSQAKRTFISPEVFKEWSPEFG